MTATTTTTTPSGPTPGRLAPVTNDPDTGGFFQAAAGGTVAVRTCDDCGVVLHLPRAHCDRCGGWSTSFHRVSPRARVYSWTVVVHQIHPAYPAPYTVALVELVDEPSARLVSYLPGRVELHAGQEMQAWFDEMEDGTTVVQWRPVEEEH